jgi:glycerophosphoryl diester phosphodiesterase
MSIYELSPWHFPHWIAHRGAGTLAPENTLAALRLGMQYGYRMCEVDAKVSSDGVVFLFHDDNLIRTSNANECLGDNDMRPLSALTWNTLSTLDVGSWHSRLYTGEPIATLENTARFCIRNCISLNIEIKPSPGASEQTGKAVAAAAARLWANEMTPPLLTSFDTVALQAAKKQAPTLPFGLLLDTHWDGWLTFAKGFGCSAIVCDHALWNTTNIASVHHAGMRALSYTVNTKQEVARLQAMNIDGLITDCIDQFTPI